MEFMMQTALGNWRDLNKLLNTFDEAQIMAMLDHEMNTKRRRMVVTRLHQRQCILRANREREELMHQLRTK